MGSQEHFVKNSNDKISVQWMRRRDMKDKGVYKKDLLSL